MKQKWIKCRECGVNCRWMKTKRGTFALQDPRGTWHWRTCRKLDDARKAQLALEREGAEAIARDGPR